MDKYCYKLVCVDENNAMGYRVLSDELFNNLDDVHTFVEDHINQYTPELTKWMLLPFKKDAIKVNGEPAA